MIYAHIAGLTQNQKIILYEKFNGTKYSFRDLDDYTDNILMDLTMDKLLNKYEFYTEKAKSLDVTKAQAKQFLIKSRELNLKINEFWKTRMEFYINELNKLSEDNSYIILVGYINFYRNIRLMIKLDIRTKIFIDYNTDLYTKEIIESNLNLYHNDIVNGQFNLQLIDPDYLIKRRQSIQSIYIKNMYDNKSFDETIVYLSNSLQDVIAPPLLFYASKYKYNTKIPIKDITAYTEEWTAIISGLNIKCIKGYDDNDIKKPFLQCLDIVDDDYSKLEQKLYLYVLSDTIMFAPIYTKNYIYKYKTSKQPKIEKIIEIENAYLKLLEYGVKVI